MGCVVTAKSSLNRSKSAKVQWDVVTNQVEVTANQHGQDHNTEGISCFDDWAYDVCSRSLQMQKRSKWSAFNRFDSPAELMEMLTVGFLRFRCESSHYTIASDVVNLCLLFCSVGDMWDTQKSDQRLRYEENDTVISKPGCDSEYAADISRYFAFGRSVCRRGQNRLWKFKAFDGGQQSKMRISIGLVDRQFVGTEPNDYELECHSLVLR